VVTQGLQSTNVVARGFNNIFSGALLTLTDHRIASVPSLRVNTLYMIPSNNEDVERMEVVLGPGSALYGPNTANGVLHIFTKSPLASQGTSAAIAGGNQDVLQGTFRTSHLLGENLGIKVSGQYLRGNEWGYTDPVEFAARNAALPRDPNTLIGLRDFGVERWGAEARADWRVTPALTTVFQVGHSNTASGIELTGIGAAQVRDWTYTYYQARMTTGRLFGQVYLNTSNAGETFTLRDAGTIVDDSEMLVGQVQHGLGFGERQNFTYGLDYLRTMPDTKGTIHGKFEDDDIITEVGGYLQSETVLHPKLDLVLAGRVDSHSELNDPVFSPRAALVFKPAMNQSFRVTYNRAFSTPTAINLFLDRGAGPAPGALGRLGFGLHAQGTGSSGFTFRGADGSYQMRSPFAPSRTALLPANVAPFYPAAVQVVAAGAAAAGAPLSPQLIGLLNSLAPNVTAQVGTSVLNPLAPNEPPVPLANAAIPDQGGIRESTTSTFEVGYKGILQRRILVAVDGWYSRRENFVSPLTVATPVLLLNGAQLGQVLVPRLMQAGVPQANAVALVTQLASVPLGVVSSADVNSSGADLLVTYQNFGSVNLYGADLSASALLTDRWTLTAGTSLVNKDFFETEGQVIALNAPRRKGVASIAYGNNDTRLTGEVRARYSAQFPVNSGVYIGMKCVNANLGDLGEECVQSYTLFDLLAGYRIPRVQGASVQLMVQNLFGEEYRSFVGTPTIGRMMLLRLKYDF
jgi:iron complex outermembrane receptor protein